MLIAEKVVSIYRVVPVISFHPFLDSFRALYTAPIFHHLGVFLLLDLVTALFACGFPECESLFVVQHLMNNSSLPFLSSIFQQGRVHSSQSAYRTSAMCKIFIRRADAAQRVRR